MYTRSSAFFVPRRFRLLLCTKEYILQLHSYEDAEYVRARTYLAIFGKVSPPKLDHHCCGCWLATRMSGASSGLYGPRRSLYSVISAITSLNPTPSGLLNLRNTLFKARFASPFYCNSICSRRYGFNIPLA